MLTSMLAAVLIAPIGRALVAACLLLAPAAAVFAQAPIPGYPDTVNSFDAREVAMLPSFCRYTQVFRENVPNDADERERWIAYMGTTNYLPVHHYCWGLMKTNRGMLLARSSESRNFYLADAIGEYDYVIRRVTPDFVLLPEILTKKAENLILLGRGPQGVVELRRAIDARNDYWPAYAKLADYYKDTGDITKARETLDEGIAKAPDAKGLQRRREELGRAKAR
jgi:tetratricopeptide (TPR) repeat protein